MDTSQEKTEIFEHHQPVLLNEIIELLKPKESETFVDGTLGLGGHSRAIANLLGPQGTLVGIEKDKNTMEVAFDTLSSAPCHCCLHLNDFKDIDEVLKKEKIDKVDAVLLDLGISSFQLDNEERGFSLRKEGPLDMRINQNSQMTAFDLINSLSEKELITIIKDYGEERFATRIAKNIISSRTEQPIKTTRELRRLILESIPVKRRHYSLHPATRTFQAFRIAVNQELHTLEAALEKIPPVIKEGGRIGIISFHSLEDRIVKRKFKSLAESDEWKILTKKPVTATEEEKEFNSRSRSAKLRVIERAK